MKPGRAPTLRVIDGGRDRQGEGLAEAIAFARQMARRDAAAILESADAVERLEEQTGNRPSGDGQRRQSL